MRFMKKRSNQLELVLHPHPRWGGKREGAGRKAGPERRDPHRRRSPLAARHPCHVTLKARRDVPSLRNVRIVRELERSWREACERGRFRLLHYSIQSDHAHLIVEAVTAHDLACGMKSLGSRLARAVNRVFQRSGPVLADRGHVHVLRMPREVRTAIAYVLLNSRRHLAKLGRAPGRARWIDPASSGRWFLGWKRALPPAADPPAVAEPRSWLASIGWRRAGRIDPSEVPGRGAAVGQRVR